MNQRDPDALIAKGMECGEGNPKQAIKYFDAALEIDGQNPQAWYGKGCAHGALEQYDEAINAYRQSAEYAGEQASLPLYNLGNLYQEIDELQEAAKCFHEAVQVDPEMADAWINLGRLLDDSGAHEVAIECYDNALEEEPRDSVAWSNRGNSLRSLERYEESLNNYQRALEIDPEDFAARIGVGACMMHCGREEEGLTTLQEVLEETQSAVAMFELAIAMALTGQHEGALVMLDALIEYDFAPEELWNNRGECLAALERMDEAVESFDKALAMDDEYPAALFGKARALVNARRVDEARPVAEKFWSLIDDDDRADPPVQELMRACGLSK